MTLGEKIKLYRQRQGLSQAKLGEILSVSQQAVAKWEKSIAEPDSTALKKMATLFQISIDELLSYYELTPEEQAAGAVMHKKISLSADEYELIMTYREVGSKHGEDAQRALITVAEKML